VAATPPRVIREPAALRAWADDARRDGARIVVVPTMGYLHDGHVALMRRGRGLGDRLLLTLFVNPTQFGPNEDLARYPRDEAGDLAKAAACGVDVVFAPPPEAMYPPGYATYVDVRELSAPLCGASRPGHFTGVATIVTKLFTLSGAHVAVFGEKDFQQLAIVRRLAADLDLAVEVVGVPIVREADGLAMSSRNAYLSAEERRAALCLSRGLAAAREAYAGGERDVARLLAAARAPIEAAAAARIDYVDLRDASSLAAIARVERPAVLALAVYFGKTRLIDNAVLDGA
jgi:pantoate--beta-alanine ligase